MRTVVSFQDLTLSANIPCRIHAEAVAQDQVKIEVLWENMTEEAPRLQIDWAMPVQDMQYMWYPSCGFRRSLRVDWNEPVKSRISSSAPVYVLFNDEGENRMTVALSDALTDIDTAIGVHEESGEFKCTVCIPLDKTGMTRFYSVILMRNREKMSFAAALRKVSAWWEQDCGYVPMEVPDAARLPLYSAWYSFHQATIAAEIEQECIRARALGLDTIIVDDGWQTGDGNRGYGYCGDWRPCTGKIPDMKAHVQRVHDLGMKYMLWYSVPFVGEWSEHWPVFKDMLLNYIPVLHCGVLDPRYPAVREYLMETYVHALKDWELDGFKLDFIDDFLPSTQAPAPKDGMDYILVEDAVLHLMQDVMQALRAIKPDIMIEFRQHYIGPAMRTFGNMFRVGDCPNDPIKNRVGVVDLRLLSGSTAVHSDMLMWHKDDSTVCAARQILNVIFSVPQLSLKLDAIPDEHVSMMQFWIGFAKEHRALLAAPMEVLSPQHMYPVVRTRLADEQAVAVYENCVVDLGDAPVTYLLNATAGEHVVLRSTAGRVLQVRTFDCMGKCRAEWTETTGKLWEISVPVSGYALICG